jgi:hypothetical protein
MRQTRIQLAAAVAVAVVASVVATTALAGGDKKIREELTGRQEVPVVLTGAEGRFRATVGSDRIEYTLRYDGLEGSVTQRVAVRQPEPDRGAAGRHADLP